ncbi:DUF262 domain-containing protein [Vibrio sp. S11_S32]|uniref:DUF262 domain-containing protein n=1 Tax=Vibrio sp. S11_S32 TaxID=2720225 RepID=UPI001681C18E|nr:DUF262 domain-containing protein [Vibrio sp. S11_S32]MBD1576898.1 DUF262 domain-containing protein [Vibrio sp. S11_S32]
MNDLNEREVIESDEDTVEDYTSDDGGIYPYSENVDLSTIEINLREDKISVFEIIRWTNKGKFVLDPEFQRSPNAWNEMKKSMFIESLILNLPLPHFYFNKDSSGRLVVIDGLQRLTAVLDFYNDDFCLVGLKALPWLNGFSKSKLEEKHDEVWSKIEDKNIPYYSIMPSVPMAVTYDIFRRINTGGTRLERQEIRNCIYLGKSTKLLKKMSELNEFSYITDSGISPKRMKDREAVLRCLAFSDDKFHRNYNGDLDDFLGDVMKKINLMDDDEICHLEEKFITNLKKVESVFGKNAFRIMNEETRGRINLAVMESIYSAFNAMSAQYVHESKERLLNKYQALILNEEYLNSVKTSTNQIKKVSTRLRLASEYLGGDLC